MGISKPARLIEKASARDHPKRVPAERSVCLRKTPPAQTSVSRSSIASQLLRKSSSAKSASNVAASNISTRVAHAGHPATAWFDDSNKNVTNDDVRYGFDGESPTLVQEAYLTVTDDPPFYLEQNQHSSNEEHTSPEQTSNPHSYRIGSRQSRAGSTLPGMRTIDSSSEDYRSVVDDLTVENQKLRAKLKRYEKLHNSQTQKDKLFEIKVYALPPAKRRKLEKTLQEFASDLGDCSDPRSLRNTNQSVDANSNSNSRDSGYASVSGAASATQSNQTDVFRRPSSKHQNHARPHSHLISPVLARRTSLGLSEKEKMEVVVKRLERVFIGKANGVIKSTPYQSNANISPSSSDQMEIDSSNHMDRSEGQREARMLHLNTDRIPARLRASPGNSSSGGTSEASMDQRPTHAIDLDPLRTQIPIDNIQYMRHLGFGSPKIGADMTYEEGEGWIYLNFLVNMAQLHTMNVTPDFVRKAVTNLSTHFELSKNGDRIRWKGGNSPTKMPSDGSRSVTWRSTGSSSNGYEGSTNVAASKSGGPSAEVVSDRLSQDAKRDPMGIQAKSQTSSSNFQSYYKPVVFTSKRSSDDSMDVSTKENSSPTLYRSDDATDREQSRQNQKDMPENGVKIYYNSSKFYADLSKEGVTPPCEDFNGGRDVVGRDIPREANSLQEFRGPLSQDPVEQLIGSIDSLRSSNNSLEGFEQFASSNSAAATGPREVFPLQASGIGGVHPDDNFSIDVEVKHSSGQPASQSRIVSENTREFPAQLPPPSYAFLPFSSSSSDEEEFSEEDSDDDTDSDEQSQREIATGKQPNMFLYAKELAQESEDSSTELSIGRLASRSQQP